MPRPALKPPRLLYLRSLLSPLLIGSILVFTLGSYFLLSNPAPAAQTTSKIGWQSWDTVEEARVKSPTPGGGATAGSEPGKGNGTTSTSGDDAYIDGSLPLDVWDPLLPHRTGLTEISVQACGLPPSYVGGFCAPKTTPEDDSRLGKWVMVEKDLNVATGIWYLNIWYRRSRRFDVPYVTSIKLIPSKDPIPPGYTAAKGDDLHSGVWPTQAGLRLVYRLEDPSIGRLGQGADTLDEARVVTEIDVLYGDGEPWWGFDRIEPKVVEKSRKHKEEVALVVRMGVKSLPPTPELRMHANGTFRIMQVADLHYSVGDGVCKDTTKSPCVGDVDSASLLAQVIDAERPDIVIFSGDQLNGQGTSWDSVSVMAKFAQPVIDRKIPWAAVFGNHDAEDDLPREKLMRYLSQMPYSLCSAGPSSIDGVGNYLLKVHSHDASKIHLASLYLLDSGAYYQPPNPFAQKEYDWIKESQIEWYLKTSAGVDPVERPFRPDGADDLGDLWTKSRRSEPRRLRRAEEKRTLVKPNALAFFHIPLPEHNSPADLHPVDKVPLDVGQMLDSGGSPKHNSEFFAKGLLQAKSGEVTASGKELSEVKVVANGHVHIAENCRRVEGIWMCFGGGGSYSGYGRIGFERRFRIFDLSSYGERISTYKHTESGQIQDKMDLVGGEAPGFV